MLERLKLITKDEYMVTIVQIESFRNQDEHSNSKLNFCFFTLATELLEPKINNPYRYVLGIRDVIKT